MFTEEQKEAKAEYQRKYIEQNKEKRNKQIRERMRRWRKENPEKARETRQRHEIKTRAKRLEYKARMRKTPKWKYAVYVDRSKISGREITITLEEYMRIVSNPCVYCGGTENIGMDRINSRIGYTHNNVSPCCEWCNKMKLNKTTEEFIDKCKTIASHHTFGKRDDRSGADFGAAILGDMRF